MNLFSVSILLLHNFLPNQTLCPANIILCGVLGWCVRVGGWVGEVVKREAIVVQTCEQLVLPLGRAIVVQKREVIVITLGKVSAAVHNTCSGRHDAANDHLGTYLQCLVCAFFNSLTSLFIFQLLDKPWGHRVSSPLPRGTRLHLLSRRGFNISTGPRFSSNLVSTCGRVR